jgi:hypothetical protein
VEASSVVPNQFFDIFARIVPGAVLLFALDAGDGPNLLERVLKFFVPDSLRDDVVPWLVVLIAVTFTLGHLLSPFVKLLDRMGKAVRKTAWYQHRKGYDSHLFDDETGRYNRLRFTHSASMTSATRIRAEYTMYGGIAAAIAVAEIVALGGWLWNPVAPLEVRAIGPAWHAVSLAIFVGTVFRYFDVHKRFCETLSAFEAESQSASGALGE